MRFVRLALALAFGLAMVGPETHNCPVHDATTPLAVVHVHAAHQDAPAPHQQNPDASQDHCSCPQAGCSVGVGVALLPAASQTSSVAASPVVGLARKPVPAALPGAPDYFLPFALAPPRALA